MAQSLGRLRTLDLCIRPRAQHIRGGIQYHPGSAYTILAQVACAQMPDASKKRHEDREHRL